MLHNEILEYYNEDFFRIILTYKFRMHVSYYEYDINDRVIHASRFSNGRHVRP